LGLLPPLVLGCELTPVPTFGDCPH